jgi:hypothetical protein
MPYSVTVTSEESVAVAAYNSLAVKRLTLETPFSKRASQVLLEPGAVHILSAQRSKRVRVLMGAAWISYGGKDILVEAGHQVRLSTAQQNALISALGNETLVYEVA